jgi:hypothetical protein
MKTRMDSGKSPPMDWRPSDGLEEDGDEDLRWTGGKLGVGRPWEFGTRRGGSATASVSPPMDREAAPMDWRSWAHPWCSNPSAWREGVFEGLWRLLLKTATQASKPWRDGPHLAKIEIRAQS